MLTRYIGYGLLTLTAWVVGLFIVGPIYPIKDWLRTFDVKWWFLNDTKPIDKYDIDSGDYGRFKHNFLGFYRQNAFRNSHWNLRMLLRPKYGRIHHIRGNPEQLDIKGEIKLGCRFGIFKMFDINYFRLSWVLKIFKWYSHGKFGLSPAELNKEDNLLKAGRYYYKLKAGKFKNLQL